MSSAEFLGLVLLMSLVLWIVTIDWRWLLSPITFPLIFVYLIWWTIRPASSDDGQPGHERFRRREET